MAMSSNAGEVAAQLVAHGVRVGVRGVAVVHMFGVMLQTQVKANASGRPGPQAPTGDYRRSIGLQFSRDGGTVRASVGTNRPQGRRLEFGFTGVDAAGRHYNQPPFPHFGPAVDKIAPEFHAAVARLATNPNG